MCVLEVMESPVMILSSMVGVRDCVMRSLVGKQSLWMGMFDNFGSEYS